MRGMKREVKRWKARERERESEREGNLPASPHEVMVLNHTGGPHSHQLQSQ